MNTVYDPAKEERKDTAPVEVAARKVDVNEDYDDDEEEDKKPSILNGAPTRTSPPPINAMQPKAESIPA